MQSTAARGSLTKNPYVMTITETTAGLLSATPRSLVRDIINRRYRSSSDDLFCWAGTRLDALSTTIGGLLVCKQLRIPAPLPEELDSGWLCDDRLQNLIVYEHPRTHDDSAISYRLNRLPSHENMASILTQDYRHRLRSQIGPNDGPISSQIDW